MSRLVSDASIPLPSKGQGCPITRTAGRGVGYEPDRCRPVWGGFQWRSVLPGGSVSPDPGPLDEQTPDDGACPAHLFGGIKRPRAASTRTVGRGAGQEVSLTMARKLVAILVVLAVAVTLTASASGLPWRPPACKHHECPVQQPPGGETR